MTCTYVKNGPSELNVAEVAWTFRHPFTARLTLEITIYRPHPRIHETPCLRLMTRLFHYFGKLNLCDRIGFLREGNDVWESLHQPW